MKVRATQKGFDGWALREIGVVFEIKDNQFSSAWMEKVSGDVVEDGIKSPLIEEAKAVPIPQDPTQGEYAPLQRRGRGRPRKAVA